MKKAMMMVALVLGLSACHVGFGIGANGQAPVATDAWGSAVAQASIGKFVPAAD